jgi:hypothetical protein
MEWKTRRMIFDTAGQEAFQMDMLRDSSQQHVYLTHQRVSISPTCTWNSRQTISFLWVSPLLPISMYKLTVRQQTQRFKLLAPKPSIAHNPEPVKLCAQIVFFKICVFPDYSICLYCVLFFICNGTTATNRRNIKPPVLL